MSHSKSKYSAIYGHFVAAVVINTLAPLLPILQRELSLTIFQSSAIPTVLTIMVMISNLLVGLMIARFGHKHVLVAGCFIMLTGLIVGFFANSFIMILLTYTIIGLSAGTFYTSLATIYADLPINMQNFGIYHAAFGLGGMFTPLLTTFWLETDRDFHEIFLLELFLVLLLLLFLNTNRDFKNKKYENFSFRDMLHVSRTPIIKWGIVAAALYAATEMGSFTWSVNMSIETFNMGQTSASLILSLFWLMFTISRVLSDFISHKTGPINLLVYSSILAAIAGILWVFGITPYSFPIMGLAFGPYYPVIQKYVNNHLDPKHRGLFNGLSYAGVGLTSTLMIPLMGSIGNYSMQFAYIPIVLISILLIFLSPIVGRRS